MQHVGIHGQRRYCFEVCASDENTFQFCVPKSEQQPRHHCKSMAITYEQTPEKMKKKLETGSGLREKCGVGAQWLTRAAPSTPYRDLPIIKAKPNVSSRL